VYKSTLGYQDEIHGALYPFLLFSLSLVICADQFETVMQKKQTQRVVGGEERYRNTLDAVRRIFQKEGLYGFYRGLVPSLFGVTHVAVQFPLYERLKRISRAFFLLSISLPFFHPAQTTNIVSLF
jgi:phosphoenolpyruvate carboxylase